MALEQLKTALARHKVALSLTPTGRLRYDAPAPIPVTVLNGLKEYRAQLLAELTKNDQPSALAARAWADGQPRTAAGLLDMPAILAQPGHCGNCARWQPAPTWGQYMGTCTAPASMWPQFDPCPLAIHAAHRCAVQSGRGWQALPGAEMPKNAAPGQVPA